MAALVWDEIGKRLYETGVKNVVLYPIDANGAYSAGYAWNGVTAINEKPSGAEPTPLWADDIKYLNLMSAEDFAATIEAYTYPDEFAECDGSAEVQTGVIIRQQPRKAFGLCYRTVLGNDTDMNDYGYKLHLVYGCLAAPSEKDHSTINETPEAITFSWEISTTPVNVTDHKPTAVIELDSTKLNETKMTAIKNVLYGSANATPRLPLPDEVFDILTRAV